MPATPLILASASVSRAQLLSSANVPYAVQSSGVDEAQIKATWKQSPAALALALANAKAEAIAKTAPADALVLGADQLLVCAGRIFDKARDRQEARDNFVFLRGKTQQLLGGTTLWQAGKPVWEHNSCAEITLRDFSDTLLEQYLDAEAGWLTKVVGGARYEGPALQLIEKIAGDYWSILGLPLLELLPALRQFGVVPK